MRADIKIKADILKTLMIEDRKEIRGIRSTIYKITYILSALSFALSSYILETKPCLNSANISILTDILIILLLWVFFIRLKKDLYHCRKCLVLRQNLINQLNKDDTNDLNPFKEPPDIKPDVSDSELKWFPSLASTVIFLKMAVIWFMSSH